MKTLYAFALVLTLSTATFAQETGVSVTVTLENVLNDQGDILAALHDSSTFMRGQGIENFKAKAEKGELTFVFENVPAGTYAVSVLHDVNSNFRMDYEANGMPKEPYGMSGNEMTMGPPTFESAAFEVGSEDIELNIRF
jgi:uncharacterized protein (DUF2141 family)